MSGDAGPEGQTNRKLVLQPRADDSRCVRKSVVVVKIGAQDVGVPYGRVYGRMTQNNYCVIYPAVVPTPPWGLLPALTKLLPKQLLLMFGPNNPA